MGGFSAIRSGANHRWTKTGPGRSRHGRDSSSGTERPRSRSTRDHSGWKFHRAAYLPGACAWGMANGRRKRCGTGYWSDLPWFPRLFLLRKCRACYCGGGGGGTKSSPRSHRRTCDCCRRRERTGRTRTAGRWRQRRRRCSKERTTMIERR